jgi:nucleoside-diphosphate-sugar epimerase
MYYDASRARAELGFDPKPIDGAIDAAVRWFTENGYLAHRREQT